MPACAKKILCPDMTRSPLTAPFADRILHILGRRGAMLAPRSSGDMERFAGDLTVAMRDVGRPVGRSTALQVAAVIFGFRGWTEALSAMPADLSDWTAKTPLRQMIGHGATLVSGGPGCGKTTVLVTLGLAALKEGRKVFVVAGRENSPLAGLGATVVGDAAEAVRRTRRGALMLIDDAGSESVSGKDLRAMGSRSAWAVIASTSRIENPWVDHLLMRPEAGEGWLPPGVRHDTLAALSDGHGVLCQIDRAARPVRISA